MTDDELLERADAVASRAYAPYSRSNVGAVLVARDGRVVEGVNVENAAYPLGVCAEQNALACSDRRHRPRGRRGDRDHGVAVRGCRQWLAEFRVDRVIYRDNQGEIATRTPDDLLPDGFLL